jgi:hypothetical protein
MSSMFDIAVTLTVFGVGWWAVQRALQKYGLVRA